MVASLSVSWIEPARVIDGVQRLGYVDTRLIGLNGFLVGALVGLRDSSGIYQRKWEELRRMRLCNEQDPLERAWGMRMQRWKLGPWRITYVANASFGVTLDLERELDQYDLIVRPDTVYPWDNA